MSTFAFFLVFCSTSCLFGFSWVVTNRILADTCAQLKRLADAHERIAEGMLRDVRDPDQTFEQVEIFATVHNA